MHRYNDESLLEMIELFAEEVGNISSEEELSDLFDENIAQFVLETYDADDTVAFSEAFHNWKDSLCKDRTIHPEQSEAYCYVGKYSQD